MITDRSLITKYLEDFHDGKIKMGLGIDMPFIDDKLRYKQGQFNVVLGLDNVGKTDFMLWYFWKLSEKNGITHTIWTGENSAGSAVRKLIQFKSGQYLNHMDLKTIYRHETEISHYFKFVDNTGFYKAEQLFQIFEQSGQQSAFIDPFTGIDRQYDFGYNMEFLNKCRNHCNKTKQTLYLSQHPRTEAARRRYTSGEYRGFIEMPDKADAEGGQGFANRCDDFIVIHRYLGHQTMGNITQVGIRKVKEVETGGGYTSHGSPLDFEYNGGLGFKEWGASPLANETNLNGLHHGGYAQQPEEEPPF